MRIFSTKIRKRILCAAAAAVIAVSGTGMTAMPVFGKETEGGQETDMRVEQAEKAMQNFLDRFYVVDEDNDRGEIVGEFFWTRAEMFEIVVDAYEKTGEEKYKDLMAQMYRGFVKSYGEDWSDNDFNDDIMWMTIGCARAYELTGETFYKEQAEHHFKLVFDRALSLIHI